MNKKIRENIIKWLQDKNLLFKSFENEDTLEFEIEGFTYDISIEDMSFSKYDEVGWRLEEGVLKDLLLLDDGITNPFLCNRKEEKDGQMKIIYSINGVEKSCVLFLLHG